jgi:hypothetical protein
MIFSPAKAEEEEEEEEEEDTVIVLAGGGGGCGDCDDDYGFSREKEEDVGRVSALVVDDGAQRKISSKPSTTRREKIASSFKRKREGEKSRNELLDEEKKKKKNGAKANNSSSSSSSSSDFVQKGGEEKKKSKRTRWDSMSSKKLSSSSFSSSSSSFSTALGNRKEPQCTLRLEYWMRSEEMTAKKREHVAKLDELGGYYGVEDHIEKTVFQNDPEIEVVLEENMFPYDCPPGVSHWTLWSREEMKGEEIQEWVHEYLMKHRRDVVEWNYDMNDNCSVDVPHYHVFLRVEDCEYEMKARSKPGEISYSREERASGDGDEKRHEAGNDKF